MISATNPRQKENFDNAPFPYPYKQSQRISQGSYSSQNTDDLDSLNKQFEKNVEISDPILEDKLGKLIVLL